LSWRLLASGELTLETAPVVRSDCGLTPGAPVHKKWTGRGTPRSLRRSFILTPIASLAVGREPPRQVPFATRVRDGSCVGAEREPCGARRSEPASNTSAQSRARVHVRYQCLGKVMPPPMNAGAVMSRGEA